jgi:glutathione S-transferase
MKLRYAPTSPFVRKVLVVAQEAGLESHIERLTTNPWAADTDLPEQNPLSKVPALVTDEGEVLIDSPVICEYLDSLGSGALFPATGAARWQALKLQALADGIMDAAILRRLEGNRPDGERSTSWSERQARGVQRTLDLLDGQAESWNDKVTIGQISVGCACGYLDFRFGHEDWRPGRAQLAAWWQRFAERPSMRATIHKE